MKTAEEWSNEQEVGGYVELSSKAFTSLVKEIQLDAWKQGMTDAAEICEGPDTWTLVNAIEKKRDQTQTP